MRVALDHITVVDATPDDLARLASATGCRGMCLFMQPMDVLPLMPSFDIYTDLAARRALRRGMEDLGVALDVAYPFTLTGRTDIGAFARAMECAADLGAGLLNVLLYDRNPARRLDNFGRFCDMAATFGHKVGVEFYPPSQIASLASALALVQAIDRPGAVGINADLLHLMRSGGSIAELADAPPGTILYGQVADGPATAPDDLDHEASSQRMLCGAGGFDVAGFVRALPIGCGLSVEIPRNDAVARENALTRAGKAVASLRQLLDD